MKYKKEADYLKFLRDLNENGLLSLLDNSVKSKDSFDEVIMHLKHYCKAKRRQYVLNGFNFYKKRQCFDLAVTSVAQETGWSRSTVRQILDRNR